MLQLNFVRDELTAALLDLSKTGRNQIVAMAERAAASDRFTARPKREVAMGEDAVVIIDAEPVRFTAGKKFKTSSMPVNPAIFRQVSWRIAMHRLPAASRSWLNYCYGDALSFDDQTILVTHIWQSLETHIRENNLPKMNGKTEKNLKALVMLAVQETKYFLSKEEYRYTQEELSQLCGVSWDNWRKRYQSRWELMLSGLNELDNEALTHVEQLRKSACCDRR
ncbi:bacteriophage antitermination protein Q [Atlantibacter sp.]|uniref:bacteriophage antitermination protein Q n=1 Tax=Atlantibacter sp. TaxID=1903473 RepID=UPI00289FB96C|nr:bacteriophage antitermination protein Q [Atlantibacter sp.]